MNSRHFNLWAIAIFFMAMTGFFVFSSATFEGMTPVFYFGYSRYIVQTLKFFCWILIFELPLIYFLNRKKFSKTFFWILASQIPWVIGFSKPLWEMVELPPPHQGKIFFISFGLMLVTHIFLFCFLAMKAYLGLENRKTSFGFLILAGVLFGGGAFWHMGLCDTTGDEPHYLLMAHSLVHDGDLDLADDYATGDYKTFYKRGILEPQGLEHVIDGRRYSHHPLGPVFLILSGFFFLGRLGAAMTMALLAVLALYLSLKVLEQLKLKPTIVQVAGWVGLFSSPFLLFSGLIFPEIPSACLVAWALLAFLNKRWGQLGLALGLMLWMHNRNVLLVIPMGLFVVWELLRLSVHKPSPLGGEGRVRGKNRWQVAGGIWQLAAGFLIPVLGLMAYFHHIYGVWTPLGAHNEPMNTLFPISRFFIGFFGLVLDQECGLWFHFPVFALMLLGMVLAWRMKEPLGRFAVLSFLFYYLAMSFYQNIGQTPATRFMVGVTPLLLVFVALAFEKIQGRKPWEKLAWVLFGLGVFVNWALAVVPWMRYNKLAGEGWLLKIPEMYLGFPFTKLEPSFNAVPVTAPSYLIAAFWMAVVVYLTVRFLNQSHVGAGLKSAPTNGRKRAK